MGGPDVIRITTSGGQGQAREGLSEGSPSAKVRADEQNSHRRPGLRASWHHTTKPGVTADGVNAAVVHRKLMLLFGEICPTLRWSDRVEARGAGWLTKAQAFRVLSTGTSEPDSEREHEHSAPRSNARS